MNNRHGMTGSPEHNSWQAMKTRCLNPNDKSFHIYGGRGITIFPEWINSFWAFFSYMGPRPEGTTLGRIDGNKGYVPGNVEWQTAQQQGNNTSRCVFLEFNGERLTKMQWSRKLGIHYETFKERLARGLTGEALFRSIHYEGHGKGYKRCLTLDGVTKTLKQWATEKQISPRTIRERIDVKHWSVESAITTPVNPIWQRNGKRPKGLRP